MRASAVKTGKRHHVRFTVADSLQELFPNKYAILPSGKPWPTAEMLIATLYDYAISTASVDELALSTGRRRTQILAVLKHSGFLIRPGVGARDWREWPVAPIDRPATNTSVPDRQRFHGPLGKRAPPAMARAQAIPWTRAVGPRRISPPRTPPARTRFLP